MTFQQAAIAKIEDWPGVRVPAVLCPDHGGERLKTVKYAAETDTWLMLCLAKGTLYEYHPIGTTTKKKEEPHG